MASLVAYDEEEQEGQNSVSLVHYDVDEQENNNGESVTKENETVVVNLVEEQQSLQNDQDNSPFKNALFQADRLNLPSLNELLPPPTQPCDSKLQEKLKKFHEMKAQGKSVNLNLQRSKAFKNPDILEKLVQFVEVNEIGSNYPKEIYDPSNCNSSDFYDELANEQALAEKKLQEIITNEVKTDSNASLNAPSNKSGSGWDVTETSNNDKSKAAPLSYNTYAEFAKQKREAQAAQSSGKKFKM